MARTKAAAVATTGFTVTMDQPFKVGVTSEYSVTSNVIADDAGKMVEVLIEYSNKPILGKIEYYETQDGKWYELKEDRFGPVTGFPLTDGTTSKFRATPVSTGTSTLTLKIHEIESDTILAQYDGEFEVQEDAVEPDPEPVVDNTKSLSYVVKENDSLISIANRFRKDVRQLMLDNNITEMRRLIQGENLIVKDDPDDVYVAPSFDKSKNYMFGE